MDSLHYPVQFWDVQMCSVCLQNVAILNDGGGGEGKVLAEGPAFF